MYKNRAPEGGNNLCGKSVRELRLSMPGRFSQRMLAERLQIEGLDLDKNAVQRIESGERFVTDIELKALSRVFGVPTVAPVDAPSPPLTTDSSAYRLLAGARMLIRTSL